MLRNSRITVPFGPNVCLEYHHIVTKEDGTLRIEFNNPNLSSIVFGKNPSLTCFLHAIVNNPIAEAQTIMKAVHDLYIVGDFLIQETVIASIVLSVQQSISKMEFQSVAQDTKDALVETLLMFALANGCPATLKNAAKVTIEAIGTKKRLNLLIDSGLEYEQALEVIPIISSGSWDQLLQAFNDGIVPNESWAFKMITERFETEFQDLALNSYFFVGRRAVTMVQLMAGLTATFMNKTDALRDTGADVGDRERAAEEVLETFSKLEGVSDVFKAALRVNAERYNIDGITKRIEMLEQEVNNFSGKQQLTATNRQARDELVCAVGDLEKAKLLLDNASRRLKSCSSISRTQLIKSFQSYVAMRNRQSDCSGRAV